MIKNWKEDTTKHFQERIGQADQESNHNFSRGEDSIGSNDSMIYESSESSQVINDNEE